MRKTYKIEPFINPVGVEKMSIKYFHNGVLDAHEYYDETVEIRAGYIEETN